jgi:prevent-host-death family protein
MPRFNAQPAIKEFLMNTQNIQSLTQFRQNANAVIKEVAETGSPVILTQNGRAAAVVVSPQEWEKTQESLAMLQLVAIRRQEINAGKAVDFDEGMRKIDAMIEAHHGR